MVLQGFVETELQPESDARSREKVLRPGGPSEDEKPRLVFADDEANVRRLVWILLRAYNLVEAQNGKQALALIRELQPDLVLLDDMMPEMTGLEVIKAVRGNPLIASTPIILLSAKGQQAEIERGLETGATRYLVKPFESQVLRTSVAEVLQEYPRHPVKE